MKTPLDAIKYKEALDGLTSNFKNLIQSWKSQQLGNMATWMNLFQQVMTQIQISHAIPGTQKASLALDCIQGLAKICIDENVAGLNEDQLKTVKSILSDEGASVLTAATGALKQLIVALDKNEDGEISLDEICGCCFPSVKQRKTRK